MGVATAAEIIMSWRAATDPTYLSRRWSA